MITDKDTRQCCDHSGHEQPTKYHTPANLAKSISIEAAELLELFQWQSVAMPSKLDEVRYPARYQQDRPPLDPEQSPLVSERPDDVTRWLEVHARRVGAWQLVDQDVAAWIASLEQTVAEQREMRGDDA